MRPTGADEALADEASALLVEQGRADLSVTGGQVLKWRQRAPSVLPIVSDRRPGRGRLTRYAPDAPVVAATLAAALAADRHYEPAVLAAFGDLASSGCGNPMAESGVRDAFDVFLRRAEAKAGQARGLRRSGRAMLPRSDRVVMPWSRRDHQGTVTDAFLDVMLGNEPKYGDDDLGHLANELEPGSGRSQMARTDERSRLAAALRGMHLAALRRVAKTADMGELAQLCADVDVLLQADRLMVRLFEASGTRRSQVTYLQGPDRIVRTIHAAANHVDWARAPRGLALTMGALGLLLELSPGGAKQRLQAYVDDTAKTIPGFTEYVMWVESLPASWRRTAAPVAGNVYFSQLPRADQIALNASLRQWVKEHSDVVRDSGVDFSALLADAETGT